MGEKSAINRRLDECPHSARNRTLPPNSGLLGDGQRLIRRHDDGAEIAPRFAASRAGRAEQKSTAADIARVMMMKWQENRPKAARAIGRRWLAARQFHGASIS